MIHILQARAGDDAITFSTQYKDKRDELEDALEASREAGRIDSWGSFSQYLDNEATERVFRNFISIPEGDKP